jgi:hypothetical protein
LSKDKNQVTGGSVKKTLKLVFGAIALFAAMSARAGGISDTGVNAYWGSDSHGYGDVIGGSTYDIQGATITRVGSVLTIAIATSFAGHAGMDASQAPGGIGYGDLFLAQTWNPFGSDAHHAGDNDNNGTLWSYGFALDNRYSNTGGSFKLYQLNGTTNDANVIDSEKFMSCTLGSACYYRNGQATAVKTQNNGTNVAYTGMTGNWTLTANKEIKFTITLASTSDLLKYSSLAMHWGETCQNDVIEGQVSLVPVPGVLPLTGLGLVMLGLARRRRRAAAA